MAFREYINEAAKEIDQLIKYIPKGVTSVKTGKANLPDKNFIIVIEYKEDGIELERRFIINAKGVLSVDFGPDEGDGEPYIQQIGKFNFNLASGMVNLSKALKTQSLIGDFEEWYMKTRQGK